MLYFSLLKSHFVKTLQAEFPSLLLSLLLSLSLTHTGIHRNVYTHTTDQIHSPLHTYTSHTHTPHHTHTHTWSGNEEPV